MRALALKLLGALLFLSALAMWAFRAPDRPVETLVARWAPPPSQFIELDGQLVHLRDEGPRDDPEPLVLLHGTGSSLHTWEGWARALRGTRRVIRFDLPAFGLTGPNAAGDYRGDTYARFVLALLDRLQVPRFVLGGNSLGGEVAWRTAVLAPQRVAKLILVDAAGPDFRSDSVPAGFLIARVPVLNRAFEYILPRAVVAASLHNVYGDPSRITPELVDRHYELALREGNRRALGQRMQQVQRGADAERIATIRVPTLILWGGRDRLVPPSVAKAFAAAIPGSEVVLFDDLGHVPHEEDAASTVTPVLQFLQRHKS
ncbi:MAG: alpha/beta fold hydrolase [Burkholderiales bacterium]|nr:alpha/beta fold hydrolase [Burkholderiales bacterium]